jgi:hypothetical protein
MAGSHTSETQDLKVQRTNYTTENKAIDVPLHEGKHHKQTPLKLDQNKLDYYHEEQCRELDDLIENGIIVTTSLYCGEDDLLCGRRQKCKGI